MSASQHGGVSLSLLPCLQTSPISFHTDTTLFWYHIVFALFHLWKLSKRSNPSCWGAKRAVASCKRACIKTYVHFRRRKHIASYDRRVPKSVDSHSGTFISGDLARLHVSPNKYGDKVKRSKYINQKYLTHVFLSRHLMAKNIFSCYCCL